MGDVHAGGLDGLVVVLDGPEDQADIHIDQSGAGRTGPAE